MNDFKLTVNKEKLESSMTREFDAPREKVWQAHVDPKLVEQWWGPAKYKTIVETYEPTVGGKWKMIHEAEGQRHVFFGEFKEVEMPEKITWTFNYEPFPNSEIVETIHFEELPENRTKITTVSHYPTIEALEGMTQSGMEAGANESWNRLANLLAK